MNKGFLEQIKGGLIVSCQATAGPLKGRGLMAAMAEAAEAGGAAAIRAEGISDIKAIKSVVKIPILGIIKLETKETPVIITPLLQNVVDLIEAGADMIAVDATLRKRANGDLGPEFISKARDFGIPILADIDNLESAIASEKAAADAISTTLAGYTGGVIPDQPDLQLVKDCVHRLNIPVIAEGRFATPDDVAAAFKAGAWSVCVGGAITDPYKSTIRFVKGINN